MDRTGTDGLDSLWRWIESFIGPPRRRSVSERGQALAAAREICRLLGHPENSFRSVHIAGSKGKGQVAQLFASALAAGGFRVGLFTSPHIHSFRERIQVLETVPGSGEPRIESLDLESVLIAEGECLKTVLEDVEIHFFAVISLLAFCAFRTLGCDWAVLETGIGGRYCPTNVVNSSLSVITPIELEHCELLGDRLEQIAGEKAGIIKPNRPCVSAEQADPAAGVLRAAAAELESPLFFVSESVLERRRTFVSAAPEPLLARSSRPSLLEAFFSRQEVEIVSRSRTDRFSLRSLASTQVENAALTLLGLDCLPEIRQVRSVCVSGLEQAFPRGRFEARLWEGPSGAPVIVVFDGAHTPVSCRRFAADLEACIARADRPDRPGRKTLLFGAVSGKQYDKMAEELAPFFDRIVLTRAGFHKPTDLPALYRAFSGFPAGAVLEEAPKAAFQLALESTDLLAVCGSFYLLGELLPRSRDSSQLHKEW